MIGVPTLRREVVVVVALFNRARTPFSEQGGTVPCPTRRSPFLRCEKTPENTRARDTGKSQTQKKSPHLPTTFDSYCQEKGHKLVQEVIHAARLAGPQPPAWNAGGDIRCRRPVGDLGQPRAPYPQVAALPPPHPTKPLGGCLKGKWCYLGQREGVRGARYRLRNAPRGALDTSRVQCQCRSGLRRLRRPAL